MGLHTLIVRAFALASMGYVAFAGAREMCDDDVNAYGQGAYGPTTPDAWTPPSDLPVAPEPVSDALSPQSSDDQTSGTADRVTSLALKTAAGTIVALAATI